MSIFEISFLIFLIFKSFNLFWLIEDPFLDRLSTLSILILLIFFFRKIAKFEPINPHPPKIAIFIKFFYNIIFFLKLYIIVPHFNEEKNITEFCKYISGINFVDDYEVIFIDDYSNDDTKKDM